MSLTKETPAGENSISDAGAMPVIAGEGATSPASDLSDAPDVTLDNLVAPIAGGYVAFDPDIHATNPDGTPSQREDGTYRKKRGRKPGSRAPQGAAAVPVTPPQASAPKKPTVKPDVLARQFLNMGVGFAVQTIGPEWDFESKDEADAMVNATAAYIEAKGGVSVSPEVMLLLVYGGYVLHRLKSENTQSKLSRVFSKIRGLFRRG